MKTKLALGLAAMMLGMGFGFTVAYADDVPSPQCMRSCGQERQQCLQATPDKADLCEAHYRECTRGCGANL
jgi:hypothetical protein